MGKPWVHVQPGLTPPRHIARFIPEIRVSRLMIAGNWETRDPAIEKRVERFLLVVFESLARGPMPDGGGWPAR
jgi:hypothetical protein